jgi:hypothetical protein
MTMLKQIWVVSCVKCFLCYQMKYWNDHAEADFGWFLVLNVFYATKWNIEMTMLKQIWVVSCVKCFLCYQMKYWNDHAEADFEWFLVLNVL